MNIENRKKYVVCFLVVTVFFSFTPVAEAGWFSDAVSSVSSAVSSAVSSFTSAVSNAFSGGSSNSGSQSSRDQSITIGGENVSITRTRIAGDIPSGSYTAGGITYDTYDLNSTSGVTHAIVRGGDGGSGTDNYGTPVCVPVITSCQGPASQLCGDTNTGTRNSCAGGCNAAAFSDTLCQDNTLDSQSLTLDPELVRTGNTTEITWDLGENHFSNCTLTGSSLPPGFTITTQTGSVETLAVTGPHRYTLSCGSSPEANQSVDLRVLPTIFES